MAVRSKTTSGKIKLNLALRPDAYELLTQMCRGPRSQGDFISDLILAESQRRQAPDVSERLRALEQQVATLFAGKLA
jgi:predicted CopG family antitoxin